MKDIDTLISQMTLEEKAGLLSGLDFWKTKAIERLGIPSMMLTDGPHGLRKQDGNSDHLGIMKAVPATCFPSAAGLACSWDRHLLTEVGEALGAECQHHDVAVLLGPGTNIKRSPLCGRNFEYFSEDPLLSSQLAAAHIKGVQNMGVGTSLKHFAANNQETRRMTIDAKVDERTLREIYLASFESAVKEGKPDTVMCSYNKINGTYASENHWLLTKILRDEWGFEGFCVSDWGAVNDRVQGVAAGLDLEMPSSRGVTDAQVVAAVKDGSLAESAVDLAVSRILHVLFLRKATRMPSLVLDSEKHHALARKTAGKCSVLLKNNNDLLPLSPSLKVAIIGGFALTPRFQGGGSSHVNPTKVDDAFTEFKLLHDGPCTYSQGYSMKTDEPDQQLIDEAVSAASAADVAVIFAGLPDVFESEGYDRKHMRLPDCHNALIEAVAAVQPKLVVVLSNGSPVVMPWIDKVGGLLETYLGGQAWGGAVADLLTGKANPGGKLAETFPLRLEHNPSQLNFPGDREKVEYREGIYVGYRWYEAHALDVLFPFGFGLSYTTFSVSDLILDKEAMTENETLAVAVKVKNTGKTAGSEVVQLYVSDTISSVCRPKKELKAFESVYLQPGEEKVVTFTLGKRAFAFWSDKLADWLVETGRFDILIGTSSADICCVSSLEVSSDVIVPFVINWNSTIEDLLAHPQAGPAIKAFFEKSMSEDSPMAGLAKENPEMVKAMMGGMPIRVLASFTGPSIDWSGLAQLLN